MLRPGKGSPSAYGSYGESSSSSPMAIPSGGGCEYGNAYAYGSSPTYASSSPHQQSHGSYRQGGYNQFSDDTFKDKPRRGSNKDIKSLVLTYAKTYGKKPLAWAVLSTVVFLILTLQYKSELSSIYTFMEVSNSRELFNAYHDSKGHLSRCRHEVNHHVSNQEDLEADIHVLERKIKSLEKERDSFQKHATRLVDEQSEKHIDELTVRDFAWKEQVEILQNATQRESMRSATELFGPGPHHVKFSVILPTDETETERHFVVEMAPLDVMPHSVHFFLQQVVHGLWHNAWFYLNGPHVMQAGPQASEDEEELWHLSHEDEDERAVALKNFREASLATLAFPEHSEKFKHDKWTLGFTGRPGGPDFYINKLNNQKSHGPGGQHQHDIAEYGDPCFAKVVDGFETLELMFKEPTYHDDHEWGWFYEDPIHIVGANIMENAPLKVEVAQPDSEHHSRKPDKPLKKHKLENQVAP